MAETVEESIRASEEAREKMNALLDGEEYIIYARDDEGDNYLYRLGMGHGTDPLDALNSFLKLKEVDLDADFFVVKAINLEGPFIIKLNPEAVRPEDMVTV